MLTKVYLPLRLYLTLALQSKNKGLLRVNPEQPPALRAESRRDDLFLSKERKMKKKRGVSCLM